MRDKADRALEDSESKIEELKSSLDEAHLQINELSAERDAIDTALQETARVVAQNERNHRAQIEKSLGATGEACDSTVIMKREKLASLENELKRMHSEIEQVDSENATLRVIALGKLALCISGGVGCPF